MRKMRVWRPRSRKRRTRKSARNFQECLRRQSTSYRFCGTISSTLNLRVTRYYRKFPNLFVISFMETKKLTLSHSLLRFKIWCFVILNLSFDDPLMHVNEYIDIMRNEEINFFKLRTLTTPRSPLLRNWIFSTVLTLHCNGLRRGQMPYKLLALSLLIRGEGDTRYTLTDNNITLMLQFLTQQRNYCIIYMLHCIYITDNWWLLGRLYCHRQQSSFLKIRFMNFVYALYMQ